MRCPWCSELEDRVVDSRLAEDGAAIRRRRECSSCGRRFTTYERVEEVPLFVLKRSGRKEPFERAKVVRGVLAAAKNRGISEEAISALASEVEEAVRILGSEVSSERIGREVLERLRVLDEVAYMRFASVYKSFNAAGDFQAELSLLTKDTPPKQTASPA